jgi:hypothetical protein
MVMINHNVVLCQGWLSSKKDIRPRDAKLRDLTWWSMPKSGCLGDIFGWNHRKSATFKIEHSLTLHKFIEISGTLRLS